MRPIDGGVCGGRSCVSGGDAGAWGTVAGVSGGLFIEHALSTASHHIEGAAPQTLADILLY